MKKSKITVIGITAMMTISAVTGCGSAKSQPMDAPYREVTAAASEEMGAQDNVQYEGMAGIYQEAYEGQYLNSEEYSTIVEQGFKRVADNPLSTFSVDVDTASYSNIRRMINRGEEIPKDAVRIEEMINYFRYDYSNPEGNIPFAVTTELSDCPWNPDHELLLAGIQAKEIDFTNRPMSNLVFLLDVSGSMYEEDKLPLVQKSFSMLAEELTENDRVSIVTYAGYEQVVLEGARGDEKVKIREALESLTAGGSTAGEAGINLAYEMAEKNFITGGNNRVILATDGDLNVGISSESELTRLIEKKRESGVHLSVLGFGTGNIKDNKMEALADHGDGNYAYIDSLIEARKVLVEEMGGTLITVAKDVKIQVEFNPALIAGYRLIGYENRVLADEDFNDDTVDAGEIGSGHRVTALYELIKSGSSGEEPALKYQVQEDGAKKETEAKKPYDDELLTVNIRYKAPNGNDSELLTASVKTDAYQKELPSNLRFASAVAEFGMILRDSEYKGNSDYQSVLELVSGVAQENMDDYKDEFCQLVLKIMDH